MQLKMIPTGTLNGTLIGDYSLTGDIAGTVTLSMTFAGALESSADSGVERAPGTAHITGTASSKYGTFAIDITR